MKKVLLFLFISCLIGNNAFGQKRAAGSNSNLNQDVVMNWGFKFGLNALSGDHCQIIYEGEDAGEGQVINKVGYMGSLFLRINFANFFIQPEAAWNYYRESMNFNADKISDLPRNSNLKVNNSAVNIIPVIGYNLIKQGPFRLGAYIGPDIRCIYNRNFESNLGVDFESERRQYSISGVAGFSVCTSRFLFDIRYEVSQPNTNINFSDIPEAPESLKSMVIEKNENILTLSLGMMF